MPILRSTVYLMHLNIFPRQLPGTGLYFNCFSSYSIPMGSVKASEGPTIEHFCFSNHFVGLSRPLLRLLGSWTFLWGTYQVMACFLTVFASTNVSLWYLSDSYSTCFWLLWNPYGASICRDWAFCCLSIFGLLQVPFKFSMNLMFPWDTYQELACIFWGSVRAEHFSPSASGWFLRKKLYWIDPRLSRDLCLAPKTWTIFHRLSYFDLVWLIRYQYFKNLEVPQIQFLVELMVEIWHK